MNCDSPIAIIDSMIESLKPNSINDSYELLSPKEVGEILKLHINTVYRIISTGQLRAYNLSSGRDKTYYRIKREDLEDYLEERYCCGR